MRGEIDCEIPTFAESMPCQQPQHAIESLHPSSLSEQDADILLVADKKYMLGNRIEDSIVILQRVARRSNQGTSTVFIRTIYTSAYTRLHSCYIDMYRDLFMPKT